MQCFCPVATDFSFSTAALHNIFHQILNIFFPHSLLTVCALYNIRIPLKSTLHLFSWGFDLPPSRTSVPVSMLPNHVMLLKAGTLQLGPDVGGKSDYEVT